MNDINTISISGRLTRDPEIRSTKTGKIFANFTIAVNQGKYVNETWTPNALFIDCTVWDKKAESAQKNLLKGVFCVVSGKIRQQEWENSEGKKQRKLSIHVEHFTAIKKNSEEQNLPNVPEPGESEFSSYFSGNDEEALF